MNQTTTISRLRKGGLTRTVAAAAVAASTALVTAQAGIIYSGLLNTTQSSLISNPNTSQVNVDGFGTAEFTLRASNNSKGPGDFVTSFANGFMPNVDSPSGNKVVKFTLGHQVDATGLFSAVIPYGGFAGFYAGENPGFYQWGAAGDGYMAFTFNPTGSTPLYGWAEITTSVGGTSVTLVDFAYDDGGAAILTGAGRPAPVPEPATTFFGLACLGALGLRRQRRGSEMPSPAA